MISVYQEKFHFRILNKKYFKTLNTHCINCYSLETIFLMTGNYFCRWKRSPWYNEKLREVYFNTYVLLTQWTWNRIHQKWKFDIVFFSISYNRGIKLSIFIVKFIRSILIKNHTINILCGKISVHGTRQEVDNLLKFLKIFNFQDRMFFTLDTNLQKTKISKLWWFPKYQMPLNEDLQSFIHYTGFTLNSIISSWYVKF